jgi:hypothetical protein
MRERIPKIVPRVVTYAAMLGAVVGGEAVNADDVLAQSNSYNCSTTTVNGHTTYEGDCAPQQPPQPESTTPTEQAPQPETTPNPTTQPEEPNETREPREPRLTTRQKLARQVLELASEGRITLRVLNPARDRGKGATPHDNLLDTARGKKALTTRSCGGRGANNRNAYIDLRLLRFMRDLGQETSYTVNSIVGQCHSNSGSRHYKGQAVDLKCPFPGSKIRIADKVGRRYGIKHNRENCSPAGGRHFHYSVAGR